MIQLKSFSNKFASSNHPKINFHKRDYFFDIVKGDQANSFSADDSFSHMHLLKFDIIICFSKWMSVLKAMSFIWTLMDDFKNLRVYKKYFPFLINFSSLFLSLYNTLDMVSFSDHDSCERFWVLLVRFTITLHFKAS